MKNLRNLLKVLLTCFGLLALIPTKANIIERILDNPKIQLLLGKPAEITNVLGLCKNDSYQRTNQQVCNEAAQADMVLKLPFEMRTVMSNKASAQSLRDLCIAAQSTAQANSYLCAELVKADKTFGMTLANERQRTIVFPSGGVGNNPNN